MPAPYELKDLFTRGQYEKAAAYWNDPQEAAAFTQWDFYYCMNSMYKLERYRECMDMYAACAERYPDFHRLDDKYSLCVYYLYVKNFDPAVNDIHAVRQKIDAVMDRCEDSPYSAKWLLVKFMTDAVENGKYGFNRDYDISLSYLERVDPGKLSTEEYRYTDKKGRERRLASNRESWYSEKSKVLLKQQKYDECRACCDEALGNLCQFHSNNDSWFRYRIAKCMKAQGMAEEAKKYVQQILSRGFTHWCLLQMMFEFEAEEGNRDKALAYAGACALSDPEHKMRVTFYADLSGYTELQGEEELTMLLRRLVNIIRAEENWGERNYQASWQITPEISALDKQAVLDRLTPVWREWRDKDRVYTEGTVEQMLPEGKSGFIRVSDGNRYYFNARDIRGENRNIGVGTAVRFTLVDRLDRNKGIVKKNAVDITVL